MDQPGGRNKDNISPLKAIMVKKKIPANKNIFGFTVPSSGQAWYFPKKQTAGYKPL